MSKTYELPTRETLNLLEEVKKKYHKGLIDYDVQLGVIIVHAAVDEKTGERKGHAIKGHAGAPAAAQVKIVPLKDRLIKKFDVELLIDGDGWDDLTRQEQVALLDHELTHIMVTGEIDDLKRPVVKMRDEDFIVWGFLDVVRRHGAAALEAQSVKRLIDKHGQLLLNGIAPEPEAA